VSDTAIRISGLGKQYRTGQGMPHQRLTEVITDLAMSPLNALRSRPRDQDRRADRPETFWALKDVSMEIGKGEIVGIIGRNGAGKSTLLKILSRITEPTIGDVWLHGRVGSLLEVGTGFHPDLSGRENIFLNGAMLGMSREEIRARFDEIVAFSEIERFLDTPVKRYSSGMYMRLAFSVAAHLRPEILLVDEILAVGDAQFQAKCLGKLSEVVEGGRTVLFVSHNLPAIERLCSSAIVLREGRVDFAGTPGHRDLSALGPPVVLRVAAVGAAAAAAFPARSSVPSRWRPVPVADDRRATGSPDFLLHTRGQARPGDCGQCVQRHGASHILFLPARRGSQATRGAR
jgi:lipopolysaccharide transport system ATP-binding protein